MPTTTCQLLLTPLTDYYQPRDKRITNVSQCYSPIYYNHDGKETRMLVMMTDTTCYGINPVYKFGTRDKTVDNIVGQQICYQVQKPMMRILMI